MPGFTLAHSAAEAALKVLHVASGAGSAVTGFVSFLQLLVRHPWGEQPVLVDANGSLDASQRRSLQKQHCHQTASKPQALRILTSANTATSPWTERGPTPQLLRRLSAIARRSLSLLEVRSALHGAQQSA